MANSCMALNSDGKRCGSTKIVRTVKYHGDPEIYGSSHNSTPSWVVTYLCLKHREGLDGK